MNNKVIISLLNGFFYKLLIRYSIYLISVLPFIYSLVNCNSILSIGLTILIIPAIIVMITGVLIFFHPDINRTIYNSPQNSDSKLS